MLRYPLSPTKQPNSLTLDGPQTGRSWIAQKLLNEWAVLTIKFAELNDSNISESGRNKCRISSSDVAEANVSNVSHPDIGQQKSNITKGLKIAGKRMSGLTASVLRQCFWGCNQSDQRP